MTEILGILWLRPWWLVGVPLALCIGLLLRRRAGSLGGWEQAIDPNLLPYLRARGLVTQASIHLFWLPAVLLALISIALAGPMTERRDQPTFRNLDAVILVMDLSPSMTSQMQFADSLTAARLIADAAAQAARPVALVVYAGEAYLANPLTTDARALGGMIALLNGETVGTTGTRPAEALQLGLKTLQAADILIADVVLISDGGGIGADTLAAARDLTDQTANLSTLDTNGQPSPNMIELARVGGGSVGTVTDPFPVVERITARPAERLAQTDYAVLLHLDLGRYLLIAALFPAALLLPRGQRR
jgi:Ca-activated chloride channel family protein